MKKLLCMVMAAIMITASITGCGAGHKEEKTSKSRLDTIKESGKLIVGTSPDFAPSEFIDNSSGKAEYVGSDIELAKFIAEKLGVELEIKAMEFSAIQQAVQSGNIDLGIAGFAYTEKRAEAMELSDKFNVQDEESYQGILVTKENMNKYATKESMKNIKIGAQNASLQQGLVESQLEDVQFQPVTSISDGVMMVIAGKIDALAIDSDNAKTLMKNYPEIAMAEFKFDYGSEGNVIGLKKGETQLLEAVNEILAEVNEQGLYKEWNDEAIKLAEKLGISMEE